MSRALAGIFVLLTLLLSGCAAPVVVGGAAAGGVILGQDERTAGTMLDDQHMELRIGSALADDHEISAKTHVNVTVYNATALLTGEAPSRALKQRIGQITAKTPNLEHMHNEIVIALPTPLSSRTRDTWITTKVKAALLNHDEVKGLKIKVVTENGTVYLLGLISRRQGDIAASTAGNVSAVKRVVKLFEYR